jgi:phosphoglycolate phosphatase
MDDISLVIFDLDGTLIDAYNAIYRSLNYTLRTLGYQRQKEQVICRAVGWGDRNLLKPFVKKRDLDRALAVYREHHIGSLRSGARLYPGVRRLLRTLRKRGYTLAVATNRPTRFSLELLRLLGIRSFFDAVLCGDKVRKWKPDPEILRLIMKRLHTLPAHAVYVGDMFIDMRAARRARVHPLAVTTGSSTRAELAQEQPELILPAVVNLLRYLPARAA